MLSLIANENEDLAAEEVGVRSAHRLLYLLDLNGLSLPHQLKQGNLSSSIEET
jgi:hypothetical protein